MTAVGFERPRPMPADDWQAKAACLGMDPNIFFPERGKNATQARSICAGCPVVAPCLDDAIATDLGVHGWPTGIRGGMTPKERRAEARGRRKADRS